MALNERDFFNEKQAVLEVNTLVAKLEMVSIALAREIALLEVKGRIESQAQQEMTDAQRQYYLRQQLKAIQDELGEGEADEIKLLREKVAARHLPDHADRPHLPEIRGGGRFRLGRLQGEEE